MYENAPQKGFDNSVGAVEFVATALQALLGGGASPGGQCWRCFWLIFEAQPA